MTEENFLSVAKVIINKLEGGYYHPNMFNDGRLSKSYQALYSASGETLFGIDRVAGGSINYSDAGKKFWAIIDSTGAANSWQWNYRGGTLEPELTKLAAKVMYPVYLSYAKSYLSEKSRAIVGSDDRLLFHFIYASWNGPGWFQYFGNIFNTAVASGTTNKDELVKIAIASRVNSGNQLISAGGTKIAGFIDGLKKKDC